MKRSYEEINEKIKSGKVNVLTASEAKAIINDKGISYFFDKVDIVTCASFEMHTNAWLYLSFGQTDPLIYFLEVSLNNVPSYVVGPTDIVLSCVSSSRDNLEYSGAFVIEDLIRGKDIHLKSTGRNYDVYPNKEFDTWFNLKHVNCGRLILNQALNQNNIVACNSGEKDLNTNMGTLIGRLENSTFNSSSYLNPLINDPYLKTIGVGTKIWVGGETGFILGSGTGHNPLQKRNDHGIPIGPAVSLSCIADLTNMQAKWVRAGFLKSFGPVLYVGIGVPIPILNKEIAESIAIDDRNIHTTIVDFSIPRRAKPTFGQCAYAELRTTTVMINKKPTLAAPMSSMAIAIEITDILKESILNKDFILNEPIAPVNLNMDLKKLDSRICV